MSNIIQSLWIGGALSKMEQLSAKSFIDNGHEYHLYTYGDVKNIPEGVVVKDGNDILPESEIFRYKNGSVSAFSNYFRFMMLHKKGGYWADTDLICVKPFVFEEEYVISSEPIPGYKGQHVTSCFIKLPKNSAVTLSAINIQKAHKKLILSGEMQWGSGPQTIKAIVEKHNLQKYILPWNNVCSCAWDHAESIVNPNKKPHPKIISRMNEIPDKMVAIHLWNEVWRRKGINKNKTFHPESLYEELKKKYLHIAMTRDQAAKNIQRAERGRKGRAKARRRKKEKQKKTIKIMFTDMWFKDINNNRFINKFKEDFHFNIDVDAKNPDYVIYSIPRFGKTYRNYPNAKKIFVCWEPINFGTSQHLKDCDYSLTYYSDLEDNKKHFYFTPLLGKFGWAENFIENINSPLTIPKKKFCCFVVSNVNGTVGARERVKFFKELCKYKKVDSFGGGLRNCDVKIPGRYAGEKWDRTYLDVIGEYKFMITFENVGQNGVVTEKIYNAFKGNTIPIYWGNQDIYKIFNKGSFINCHDFENFQESIDYIKKVDSDDELYYTILNKQKLENTNVDFYRQQYEGIWKKVLNIT